MSMKYLFTLLLVLVLLPIVHAVSYSVDPTTTPFNFSATPNVAGAATINTSGTLTYTPDVVIGEGGISEITINITATLEVSALTNVTITGYYPETLVTNESQVKVYFNGVEQTGAVNTTSNSFSFTQLNLAAGSYTINLVFPAKVPTLEYLETTPSEMTLRVSYPDVSQITLYNITVKVRYPVVWKTTSSIKLSVYNATQGKWIEDVGSLYSLSINETGRIASFIQPHSSTWYWRLTYPYSPEVIYIEEERPPVVPTQQVIPAAPGVPTKIIAALIIFLLILILIAVRKI